MVFFYGIAVAVSYDARSISARLLQEVLQLIDGHRAGILEPLEVGGGHLPAAGLVAVVLHALIQHGIVHVPEHMHNLLPVFGHRRSPLLDAIIQKNNSEKFQENQGLSVIKSLLDAAFQTILSGSRFKSILLHPFRSSLLA